MLIKKVFPTQIYFNNLIPNASQLSKFCRELEKDCYRIYESDENGKEWSVENYVGGYTSYESIHNLHEVSSLFQKFKKQIDRHVLNFAKSLDYDLDVAKLDMVSSWINIVGPKCYHGLHLHPLSTISGTFYLNVPKGSGALKFEDPRLSKMMATPPRKESAKLENQNFLYFKPQRGKLVLFESWLRHEVEQNLGNDDRVSISFNYHW